MPKAPKESDKKPERPPITELHKSFYKGVGSTVRHLTDVVVQDAIGSVGTEPPKLTRDILHECAAFALYFRNPGQSARHSRPFEGNIAGSDFFTFDSIILPEEGVPGYGEKVTPGFAGHLITMSLLYGGPTFDEAHPWEARLYTGQGTPPVFVDEKAAFSFLAQTRPVDSKLSDLWRLQKDLPEGAFHYPTSNELAIVLKALQTVRADVDYLEIVERTTYHINNMNDPNCGDPNQDGRR